MLIPALPFPPDDTEGSFRGTEELSKRQVGGFSVAHLPAIPTAGGDTATQLQHCPVDMMTNLPAPPVCLSVYKGIKGGQQLPWRRELPLGWVEGSGTGQGTAHLVPRKGGAESQS